MIWGQFLICSLKQINLYKTKACMRHMKKSLFLSLVSFLFLIAIFSSLVSASHYSYYDNSYYGNNYNSYYNNGYGSAYNYPGYNSLRYDAPRIYGLDYPSSSYNYNYRYNNYPSYSYYDGYRNQIRGYDGSTNVVYRNDYRSNSFDFYSSGYEYKSGFYRTESGYVRDVNYDRYSRMRY